MAPYESGYKHGNGLDNGLNTLSLSYSKFFQAMIIAIGVSGGDYFRMHSALCCIVVRMITAESRRKRRKKRKKTRDWNLHGDAP
jgi:hypothetical protein